MGSSGSKQDSYLTTSQLISLFKELETTSTSDTDTVIASHINKEKMEEIKSKKFDEGMRIKNMKTGTVLAVTNYGGVVLEEESMALRQIWKWEGIGSQKNLRNKAHNGVLEVVDEFDEFYETNLAINVNQPDPLSPMQKWSKERIFASCQKLGKNVLDVSSDGKPIYREKNGGISQQWEIENYLYWDTFFIQNRATNNILGVFQDSGSRSQHLRMMSRKHRDSQVWAWQGRNQLKNQTTGLVLHFLGDSQVGVYEPHGGTNQQWTCEKEYHIRSQDGGQMLDLDFYGQVVMSQAHGGLTQKWDLIPVTRVKVIEKKIETLKQEKDLEKIGSNKKDHKRHNPTPFANVPILKVSVRMQENLRKQFQLKKYILETFMEFSISNSSFPMKFETNKEKVIMLYDTRLEKEAREDIFEETKNARIHIQFIKTSSARPVAKESATTSGYQSIQHSGYPAVPKYNAPSIRGLPSSTGIYYLYSGSFPSGTGSCPIATGDYLSATECYHSADESHSSASGGLPLVTRVHLPANGNLSPPTGGHPPATRGLHSADKFHSPAIGGHPPVTRVLLLANGNLLLPPSGGDHATMRGHYSTAEPHSPASGGHPPATRVQLLANGDLPRPCGSDHATMRGHYSADESHSLASGDHLTATRVQLFTNGDLPLLIGGHPPATRGHHSAYESHSCASESQLPATRCYIPADGKIPPDSGSHPPAKRIHFPAYVDLPSATRGHFLADEDLALASRDDSPPTTGRKPSVTGCSSPMSHPPETVQHSPPVGYSMALAYPNLEGDLQVGWEVFFNQAGQPYFLNHTTRKVQWERPSLTES